MGVQRSSFNMYFIVVCCAWLGEYFYLCLVNDAFHWVHQGTPSYFILLLLFTEHWNITNGKQRNIKIKSHLMKTNRCFTPTQPSVGMFDVPETPALFRNITTAVSAAIPQHDACVCSCLSWRASCVMPSAWQNWICVATNISIVRKPHVLLEVISRKTSSAFEMTENSVAEKWKHLLLPCCQLWKHEDVLDACRTWHGLYNNIIILHVHFYHRLPDDGANVAAFGVLFIFRYCIITTQCMNETTAKNGTTVRSDANRPHPSEPRNVIIHGDDTTVPIRATAHSLPCQCEPNPWCLHSHTLCPFI